MKKRKILVTSALPYANGSIHLGHIMEVVQTDIWVRFQKIMGNECYYFCADDTHGTPVMLAAKNLNISPTELIEKIQKEHIQDFSDFSIHFDNYYSTHSKENQKLSEEIYLELKSKGHIIKREIEQSYCQKDQIFLPDRYIKGNCPACKTEEQYGDSCESCGKSYSPTELINSFCILCGETPILKKTEHIFFQLNHFEDFLKNWIETENLIPQGAVKKLQEWFSAGLQAWDISRDSPYFGFEIPEEKDKFFYVWLDAPIGYIASSLNFFRKEQNLSRFDEFWHGDDTEIVHFIGKDISYFHTLFWPAMLKGAGYNTPKKVHIHGFIKVNGEKMSKSKGTFIQARDYLRFLDSEHFRFYLASKLNSGMDDLDFSFDEYRSKINSDLIGNLINLISRVSTSILDKLDRKIGFLNEQDKQQLQEIRETKQSVQTNYETYNYHQIIRTVTKIGDSINKKINDLQPWKLIHTEPEKVRELVTFVLNASRYLAIYLYPIVPNLSNKIYQFLGLSQQPSLSHLQDLLENKQVSIYNPITKRIDEKALSQLQNFLSKEGNKPQKIESKTISIDDFSKVDLRVGKILEAKEVHDSKKLLQLKVDFGELGLKNVFAGIKNSYKPENLQGLQAVFMVNLQPRKMKFGISEAMILAVGDQNSILVPHKDKTVHLGDRLS